MNFDFSDDQKVLRDSARRFLEVHSARPRIRTILEGAAPQDAELWAAIAEMGWHGTAIPEAYGGLGLGHLELCVIAEELGRALACTAFGSSIYLAAEALMLAGSEAQKQHWLPKLAKGSAIGTMAWAGTGTRLVDNLLEGEMSPVADGMVADLLIVLAKTPEPTLCLVDPAAGGVTREALKTIDPTRSAAKLTFQNTPAEIIGRPGEGEDLRNRIQDHAAVLIAFEQLGAAQICLETARDYALQRHAFGRPIGSFQAIKHKLVDIYVATELARSNAYYGAWALSTAAADLPAAAAGARISATDVFDLASKENIQIHGGIGFTWEADPHLFYRRAKWLGHLLGTNRVWKDRLINSLEQRNVA